MYRERVQQMRAVGRPVYASPIVADGMLYIVTRHDGTLIIPATTEFIVESHNVQQADGTDFNATPAVYDNQLLLRLNQALYSIKSKGRSDS